MFVLRNEAHSLHYILSKNSTPRLTEYQERVAQGRLTEPGLSWEELQKRRSTQEMHPSNVNDDFNKYSSTFYTDRQVSIHERPYRLENRKDNEDRGGF